MKMCDSSFPGDRQQNIFFFLFWLTCCERIKDFYLKELSNVLVSDFKNELEEPF